VAAKAAKQDPAQQQQSCGLKKVIVRKLNSDGRIPFHSHITIWLPNAKATTANTANFVMIATRLAPLWTSFRLCISLLLTFREVVDNELQTAAQML
jgi:hypothetical protein